MYTYLAVVVAQLVERSLPTGEIRGLISIGDINIDQYSTNCNLEKTKIKNKEAGYGPSLKKCMYIKYVLFQMQLYYK